MKTNESIVSEYARHKDAEIATRLYHLGEFKVLKAFCGRALKEYPFDGTFWRLLGLANLQLGDLSKAKKSFRRSFLLSHHDKTALQTYLYSCLLDGDENSAFEMIEKEFPSFNKEEQKRIAQSMNESEAMLKKSHLRHFLCRNKVIEAMKYRGLFEWSSQRRKYSHDYF